MPLAPGQTLGPYEILAPLGVGGMGEVYRARDTRLGREVALKVLPVDLADSAEARERFEREARAVAALSHPNILALFDTGASGGIPYAAMELLEGQTLRERLAEGPMPLRKALDVAVQVARGLAAAHGKGICHRDIKPENLFLTSDGQAKILDFGLAKASPLATDAPGTESPTVSKTVPGRLMGTVGYMSPEQARGKPADTRSDIFSFGAVLYEMVSGRRAFRGDSAADTLSALLREDPPPLAEGTPPVSPALDRVIHRCLEKDPAERFQSARDLAFSLEALSATATTGSGSAAAVAGRTSKGRSFSWGWPAAACACALLAVGAVFVAQRRGARVEAPRFQQVTYRQGSVGRARWGPAGRGTVFSAAWDGTPMEVYAAVGADGAEPMPLGIKGNLLAVSPAGELAVQMNPRRWNGFQVGMLARAPLGGGAPREVLDNVQEADWSPDGKDLAVLRQTQGTHWIVEYPVGHAILDTTKRTAGLRVSPDGTRLALLEAGVPVVLDQQGARKELLAAAEPITGLTWAPAGKEVWFSASEKGGGTALCSVSLTGRRRVLYRLPGGGILHDLGAEGALIGSRSTRGEVILRAVQDRTERDLSWLDQSYGVDISSDGKTLLLNEVGAAEGEAGAYFWRRTDGSPATKLGEGLACDLSWDGALVLSKSHADEKPSDLFVVPTGAGRAVTIPVSGLSRLWMAWFFPDGKRLLLSGAKQGEEERYFTLGLEGGTPVPLTPGGSTNFDGQKPISPDGRTVCYHSGVIGDFKVVLQPVAGGEARALPGYEQGDIVADWSGDGRYLFVFRRDQIPAPVVRIEVSTGKREPWRELAPSNPAGILGVSQILLTPDGAAVAYSYPRRLDTLYAVKGLM